MWKLNLSQVDEQREVGVETEAERKWRRRWAPEKTTSLKARTSTRFYWMNKREATTSHTRRTNATDKTSLPITRRYTCRWVLIHQSHKTKMTLLRQLGLLPLTPGRSLYLRPATRFYSDWRSETASKWSSPEEIEQARHWIETFKVEDIPRKACTISYSASSGPGGQNVNR